MRSSNAVHLALAERLSSFQALESANPTLCLNSTMFDGQYDEDVGSTLVFDRASLKRTVERQAPSAHPQSSRDALLCVTTKRIKLQRTTPYSAPFVHYATPTAEAAT